MLHSYEVPLDDFWIQDVYLLGKKPLWLNGTPILADKKMRLVFPGNDAFVFLQTFLQNRKLEAHKTPQGRQPPQNSSLFSLPDEESNFKEPERPKKITETSLADLIAAREAQVPTPKQPT